MPFEINLEEGERLIANLSFVVSGNSEAFHIAITNHAIFLPRKKFFALKDPTYCERVPLNQIVNTKIKKLNPFFLWTLALLMVVGGAVITELMMLPVLRGEGGQLSGYPPAVALVGLVIPFIARRRYGLSISMVDESFLWKPPLLVDKTSRTAVELFLTQAAGAFRQAGINHTDERENSLSDSLAEVKTGAYPVAQAYIESSKNESLLRPCYHCGKPLKISHWEDWNGFLFRCPHCEQIHGKPWNAPVTLLASVLLNAFSFFCTLRWRQALPLFMGFLLLSGIGSFVLDRGQLSETLKLVLLGMAFLGPLAINSVLLLQHEIALKKASAIRT